MSGTHKLSSNELAALVGGLMDLDATEEDELKDGDISYKPYQFGDNNLSLMGDYYGLKMINERFCRLARSVFLPMLRLQPRISAFPPEVKTFSDYSDEVENFVSLTTSRIEALRGNQMMVIPPSFISMLTDSYYGGTIRNTHHSRTEFTPTEQRVIELISNGLNESMALAWRDLMPISFELQNREENLSFASFADSEDLVVNCSFMVQLPDTDPANFDVIYPLQTLKPIAGQLRSRMHSDLLEEDMSWREKMERAVLNVPLSLTAILAEPSVSLGRIGNVVPGEVVPVQMTPAPRLLVEGRPIFDADLGESAGKSALNLTRRIPD
ncbi:Flagellar motor switch protein FliM [Thalassovita gelatinovora]|uniref:Flagellar motor switch protein FliM n=1 Tax=Thalassovita gelatinovora TaxID=53501 RepID=A0A0P1FK94_THAGE|nr:flagellar motor switch protein FliM [Thalassovita gelatinovora]QIZ82403.1 flagellar motor switch protein FliM [Thalassovita gelatinovora]CUH68484.1 Flagellar motor switch protein FliM [Thalassovita gelatinovora]SEQ53272.1 flagellar motor switch protein FliM [Thalassovita gelatinovora]